MEIAIEKLKRRFDRLKSERESQWDSHYQEVAELTSPRKADFTGYRTPGEKRMEKVFDSTGIHALELLAAGLHGMATNPASKWFSLRMTDDRLMALASVQAYLADVEQIMWSEMYAPGSNFTTALHEVYQDLGAFGTAVMFMGQKDDGSLLFEAKHLAEVYIDTNADGEVDTVYTCCPYTVRQIVDDWGIDNVSDHIREYYQKEQWDEVYKIVHVVSPRKERDVTQKGAKNMPFVNIYFEHETMHKLEEGGFPEFPYAAPRWQKRSGERYGRSPAMTALPDIKMLQAMMLTTIKAAQKATDPPLFIPDDGMLGPVRTVPGGLNFYRGQREIFPLPTSDKLAVTFEMMEALRNRIRTTFYTDILQIVTEREMTATEVIQRTQERMRLLGPVIGRLEAELLGPLVTRVFGILHRLGKLPEAPEELSEKPFTVEYVSPIATAQKQQEANALLQVMQYAQPFFAVNPQLMARVFHEERTVRWLSDLFNVNPDIMTTEDEVAAAQQQEQAMQAMQMGGPAAQMLQAGAGAAKDLSAAQGAPMDLQGMMAQLMSPETMKAAQEGGERAMSGQGGGQVVPLQRQR